VNGRKVDIPSCLLVPGDTIRVRQRSRKLEVVHEAMRRVREERVMPYLNLDKAKMEGAVLARAKREQIPVNANEKLVVELYSK
jgi:small subunit ribosomal protein S4